MLTINAEIKKDGLRSDGTYNVKLRFTLDRKMRRLSTSLFVTSKDLTKELKIKQNSPIKRKHSVNHVFLSPTSIINFTSKKQSYDDTRRSGRDNELLQRAQNDL